MADQKGLTIRKGTYTFQARIPKKYHSHYPKATIYEKLPTDNRKEANRLVSERWATLHQEFARIDSTGSILKTIPLDHEADFIIATAIHRRMKADEEIRADGVDDDKFEQLKHWTDAADESERLAISRGILTSHTIAITSDWLQGYGYEVNEESEGFKQFAFKFIRAQAQVTKSFKLRDSGEYVETPPAPLIVSTHTNSNQEETLESLRLYWLTQSVKSRTSKAEAILIIKKFKKMVGDIKPKDISRKHVVQLKDKMLEDGSSPATINKGRGILAAIFQTAKDNTKIDVNPFSDMSKLTVPKGEVEKSYNIGELQTLFNSPVYTKRERPKRFQGESSYWIPLMALYSGARMNELGQVFTEDVGIEDDIDFYTIKQDTLTGRTTKTGESRRVPIHPDLIKMGFLDYVDKMRRKGSQQLFPELKVTRAEGKLADKWGDWWRGYVRKELGITRIPQPTHGFRHTFIAHCRRSKVDLEHMRIISGHRVLSMDNEAYKTEGFPLEPLYEELQKLTFRDLDLSHLYKS